MKDQLYRKVLNMQTGKEVLEPLCEQDIIRIANEIKKHNKSSEGSDAT
jgi:hypothetical protein